MRPIADTIFTGDWCALVLSVHILSFHVITPTESNIESLSTRLRTKPLKPVHSGS